MEKDSLFNFYYHSICKHPHLGLVATEEYEHRIVQIKNHEKVPLEVSVDFSYPSGIAVAGENIVVCDSWNHRIVLLTPEGRPLKTIGSYGSGVGQFDQPRDVCRFKEDWLVADHGNARIVRLNVDFEWVNDWTVQPQYLGLGQLFEGDSTVKGYPSRLFSFGEGLIIQTQFGLASGTHGELSLLYFFRDFLSYELVFACHEGIWLRDKRTQRIFRLHINRDRGEGYLEEDSPLVAILGTTIEPNRNRGGNPKENRFPMRILEITPEPKPIEHRIDCFISSFEKWLDAAIRSPGRMLDLKSHARLDPSAITWWTQPSHDALQTFFQLETQTFQLLREIKRREEGPLLCGTEIERFRVLLIKMFDFCLTPESRGIQSVLLWALRLINWTLKTLCSNSTNCDGLELREVHFRDFLVNHIQSDDSFFNDYACSVIPWLARSFFYFIDRESERRSMFTAFCEAERRRLGQATSNIIDLIPPIPSDPGKLVALAWCLDNDLEYVKLHDFFKKHAFNMNQKDRQTLIQAFQSINAVKTATCLELENEKILPPSALSIEQKEISKSKAWAVGIQPVDQDYKFSGISSIEAACWFHFILGDGSDAYQIFKQFERFKREGSLIVDLWFSLLAWKLGYPEESTAIFNRWEETCVDTDVLKNFRRARFFDFPRNLTAESLSRFEGLLNRNSSNDERVIANLGLAHCRLNIQEPTAAVDFFLSFARICDGAYLPQFELAINTCMDLGLWQEATYFYGEWGNYLHHKPTWDAHLKHAILGSLVRKNRNFTQLENRPFHLRLYKLEKGYSSLFKVYFQRLWCMSSRKEKPSLLQDFIRRYPFLRSSIKKTYIDIIREGEKPIDKVFQTLVESNNVL